MDRRVKFSLCRKQTEVFIAAFKEHRIIMKMLETFHKFLI